ncbi:MAG: hypothetical protein IPG63_11315 [Xanthomonadales bacterium]|nr:hypothetical protein [Xanthomonadales bacterium]MBK7145643.1 hypothetical protein [Xanthomonadales bacterium]MCC6560482.1 hypothetical protein [Xanthomonadales bacterium]
MARFVVCASREFGDVSGDDLTVGRIYEVLATERDWLRIVDDSGEDFLYPAVCFEDVSLSDEAAKRLHDALHRLAA